jgi:hypothetical protein|tara:strand:- start:48 stop:797 length:750 start_codon:yes stop_codon:yes gene_type:complete
MSNEMQLDLFEGKVLTVEQRLEVQTYIKRSNKNTEVKFIENNKIQLILDRAGFKEGIDYINDFETVEKTYEGNFGYSYNNTEFTSEITVITSKGGCQILFDTIGYKNLSEIKMGKSFVYREDNKLQCTSITDQYRYYKPTSLLTKLKEHNEKIKNSKLFHDKTTSIANYTVEKYQKLYPEAKVKINDDYDRRRNNYSEFKVVKVTFKSGSYVTFRLGYEQDGEYVHGKHNAENMTTKQLMETFNNQKSQ